MTHMFLGKGSSGRPVCRPKDEDRERTKTGTLIVWFQDSSTRPFVRPKCFLFSTLRRGDGRNRIAHLVDAYTKKQRVLDENLQARLKHVCPQIFSQARLKHVCPQIFSVCPQIFSQARLKHVCPQIFSARRFNAETWCRGDAERGNLGIRSLQGHSWFSFKTPQTEP